MTDYNRKAEVCIDRQGLDNSPHFVSVIVPVFNDTERLKRCLESLERQTYGLDMYEVIVIDNGSDDDVGAAVAKFPHARFVREILPGAPSARNRGISVSKGSILAFTDADCVPYSDWLEKGVTALSGKKDCGFVAGRIDFFYKDRSKPTIWELYDSTVHFQQELYVKTRHFGATANIFTTRHIFDDIGLFDAETFRISTYEDVDWCSRAYLRGYKQLYSDEVRVAHPARGSFEEVYSKLKRVIEGRSCYIKKNRGCRSISGSVGTMRSNICWFGNRVAHVYRSQLYSGKRLKLLAVASVFSFLHLWQRSRCAIDRLTLNSR